MVTGGDLMAAKDIDRSLRISTDSKTPYSDATQVKYPINLTYDCRSEDKISEKSRELETND